MLAAMLIASFTLFFPQRNQAHFQELIKAHLQVVPEADTRSNLPLPSSVVVMLHKFEFVCGFGDDRILRTNGRDVMLYHANYAKGSEDKLAKLAKLSMLYLRNTAAGARAGSGGAALSTAQPPPRRRYVCAGSSA